MHGDVWTLALVNEAKATSEPASDSKIVIKQDYYDLRDFAYYGSMEELFRSTMTDLYQRFPRRVVCKHSQSKRILFYD